MSPSRLSRLICPGDANTPHDPSHLKHDWQSEFWQNIGIQGVLLCPDHDGCPSNEHDPLTHPAHEEE